MQVKAFKYVTPFLFYLLSFYAFSTTGIAVWVPVVYSWIIIPLIELLVKPNSNNLTKAEEEMARADKAYDLLLYMVVPLQYIALGYFLYTVTTQTQSLVDIVGKVMLMGLLCG